MAERSWSKRAWYGFLHVTCRLTAAILFRTRVAGREHEPAAGGVLVLSNHQSHLDPVLIGLACQRRLNYLARKSLFKFPPFRWLIDSLDAIPIDRDGSGFGGLKETLRRLKAGEMVLIFPEGTRTPDGEVGELMPGFCALAKRAGVPLLPVAMEGAFHAWPKRRNYPLPAMIHIRFGAPILPEEIPNFATDEELLAEVGRRIGQLHAAARASRQSSLE